MAKQIKARQLTGFWELTRGLIGYQKPLPMYFKTRWGIHTFGVRFPLDILILDKNQRVVRMEKGLNPCRIYVWPPVNDGVLELPAGTIEKKRIKTGDIINISW